MDDKDEERVVLERSLGEDEWRQPAHVAPAPPEPLLRRVRNRLPDWADYEWARWLRRVVAGLVIVALALLAVEGSFKGFKAEGISMQPAVHNGDHLIINRLAYAHIDFGLLDWLPVIHIGGRWARPSRGDIIAFRSPVEDKELVKRVIGLPGETVTIADGSVSIDGHPLNEPYVAGQTLCLDTCTWTVPDDSYFVLGDNRENSLDSRQGWFVPLGNVAGKKLLTY